MANYRAISSGNWSNLATWQDDSLGYFAASSVLPTSSDDVFANGFTVTIDGTRVANSIRNTIFTPPTRLGDMSVPQMTSAIAPSGVVSVSSFNSGGGSSVNQTWFAFDRNTGTGWQNATTGQTGFMSYEFPTGRIIKRYGFFSWSTNTVNIRTWTFEGSNNGSSWTTLDTQTNFVTGVSTFYSFDISSNVTSYTYYRINVTATQGATVGIIISEFEMSEVTNLYESIISGGQFTFENGGNLTCSSSQAIHVGIANTPVLEMNLPSSNTGTFTGSVLTILNITNYLAIRLSNTGTLNLIGNYNNNSISNIAKQVIQVTANGVLNIIGNLSNSGTSGASQHHTLLISSICVLNITGSITGGAGNNGTISSSSGSTINITGDVIGGTSLISSSISISGGSVNVIGNVNSNLRTVSIVNSATPAVIDVNGIITSGTATPAIQGLVTTLVIVRGNVINTDTYNAIFAGRITINDNVTSWNYRDSTNTIDRTLYSAGVALGNPLEADVRDGVDYGPSLELTGILSVPTPDNVRKGVPTDNTIGTAELTAEDILDAIAVSTNAVAVRLRNVSTVDTTGTQIASYLI